MSKAFFISLVVGLIGFGCKNDDNDHKVEYIKIVDFGAPETVNLNNKGRGLGSFVHYEPAKDSFVFRHITDIDSVNYVTIVANLNGSHFDDSLYLLIEALGRYKDGYIYGTNTSGDAYCGPSYYVEYKKNGNVHYNYFILNGDDTLSKFSHFYNHMNYVTLNPTYVDNNVINEDEEVVNALKRMGVYDNIEYPYIPKKCGKGIDKAKIIGSWRLIQNELNQKHNFTRLVFTTEDSCFYETVRSDTLRRRIWAAVFYMNAGKNTLSIRYKDQIRTSKILNLTDSCMAVEEHGKIVEYNKL